MKTIKFICGLYHRYSNGGEFSNLKYMEYIITVQPHTGLIYFLAFSVGVLCFLSWHVSIEQNSNTGIDIII